MEALSRVQVMRFMVELLEMSIPKENIPCKNYASDSDDEDYIPTREHSEVSDCEESMETKESETESEEDDDDESPDSVPIGVELLHQPSSTITFTDNDYTIWSETSSIQYQTQIQNKSRQRFGPHKSTETLSISETFKKVFSIDMVEGIVHYTNKKAIDVCNSYNEKNPTEKQLSWINLNFQEFYAFLGILIMSGVNNSNADHCTEMWKLTSNPLYRAAMGINRFCNILRFIRFDDANTREVRKSEDKVAPIRHMWTVLNANLIALYKPTACLKIDEQLYPYRGLSKISKYRPSKPVKYGIKVYWICDAETSYPLKGKIYNYKTTGRKINQGERIVKDLAAPYKGSGKNILMDNFFTTLSLAKHLLSWNLTMVGTLKNNKKYIPANMQASKDREELSTLYGFHEKVTICSYVPKKRKAVILLSTMHSDATISSEDKKNKPEMLCYYNKKKIGVDSMDQMLDRYTTHRETNRFPLAFFFNILDVSCLASSIIYHENNKMLMKKTNERKLFLRQLGEELCMPSIEARSQNIKIMRNFSTRIAIESIYGKPINFTNRASTSSESGGSSQETDFTGRKADVRTCYICHQGGFKKRIKTRKSCIGCNKPVCSEHSKRIAKCQTCLKIN